MDKDKKYYVYQAFVSESDARASKVINYFPKVFVIVIITFLKKVICNCNCNCSF